MDGLRLSNVSVWLAGREQPVLHHLNLSVSKGEVLGLIGVNGAGKSTCAHAVTGVVPYFYPGKVEGSIEAGDTKLGPLPIEERSHHVGFAFQDADSQVLFGTVADVLGVNEHDTDTALLEKALELLGVKHLLTREPNELSGGQLQRIAFIAALRKSPGIVIYDEALTGLDPTGRRQFGRLLQLLKEDDRSIIVIGQRPSQLKPFVDRIFEIPQPPAHGEIGGAHGSPAALDLVGLEHGYGMGTGTPQWSIALRKLIVRLPGASSFRLGPLSGTIEPGSVVALVGKNGSGKSTLMQALLGNPPVHKRHLEFGATGNGDAGRKSHPRIGFLSQFSHFQIIASTVEQEIASHAPHLPASDRQRLLQECQDALPFLLADRDPLELSYGQQKMLSLLGLAVGRYDVLMLDEPELGLDQRHYNGLRDWLLASRRSRDKIVVFSSHDLELVEECADVAWVLENGKLVNSYFNPESAVLYAHFA